MFMFIIFTPVIDKAGIMSSFVSEMEKENDVKVSVSKWSLLRFCSCPN